EAEEAGADEERAQPVLARGERHPGACVGQDRGPSRRDGQAAPFGQPRQGGEEPSDGAGDEADGEGESEGGARGQGWFSCQRGVRSGWTTAVAAAPMAESTTGRYCSGRAERVRTATAIGTSSGKVTT